MLDTQLSDDLSEPGLFEGETREEAVERLIKVMESMGFIITDKKQKTVGDDAER